MLFFITLSLLLIIAMSKKSHRPSMEVKDNLEMEEQLQLFEAVV